MSHSEKKRFFCRATQIQIENTPLFILGKETILTSKFQEYKNVVFRIFVTPK